MKQVTVRWSILHRRTIMRKTDISLFIDHTVQGHASQFEQIDFLPIPSCHGMIGIRQTDERNIFVRPILFKCRRRVGTDCKHLCLTPNKPLIIFTQARQLRAAIRSHEPAQEGKHYRLAPTIVRKAHKLAIYICQLKVRSRFSGRDQFTHRLSDSKNLTVASTTCCCWSAREMVASLSPGWKP